MPRRPYNTDNPDAPNRLRYWRKARGLTQEGLAERMGTTKQTIQRYETGKLPLTDRLIFRLSEILEIEPASLLPGAAALSESAVHFARRYEQLDTNQRKALESLAEQFEAWDTPPKSGS